MNSLTLTKEDANDMHADTFLPPIEKPQGLMMKLAYYFTRRQFGKVLTPLKVHSARLPACLRSLLREDRQARREAAAVAGDCPARSRASGAHQRLSLLHRH